MLVERAEVIRHMKTNHNWMNCQWYREERSSTSMELVDLGLKERGRFPNEAWWHALVA